MRYFDPARETPDYTDILYVVADGVATVTLNRPHAYNCYSTPALAELAHAFERASFDDAVHAVVYTGAGTRAFCTGGDVKEYEREYVGRPRDYWKYMGLFRAYIESIMRCAKPVIARLNGMAVGGGNESQLACDLTVMGNHTFVSQVGTGVGSVACGGSTQWLPLMCGDKRAREILYLNERIPAAKALDWGLVNRVVATVKSGDTFIDAPTPEQISQAQKGEGGLSIDLAPLDAEVKALTDHLRDKFPECLRYTKVQANVWKEFAWNQTVPHAQDWLALHYTSREPWEGMSAFVEKRPVDFAGLRARWAEDRSPEFVWGPPQARCGSCGATGLPTEHQFCGACGAAIEAAPVK